MDSLKCRSSNSRKNGKIFNNSIRWMTFIQTFLFSSTLVHLILGVEGISASVDPLQQRSTFQLSPKELRRLRTKGLEMVPTGNAVSGGTLSQEPSCEELRAMWRYYRRHARAAELTNQIPQFQLQDFFWDIPRREPASFAGPLRGRTRPHFRPKGPPVPLFGRVVLKQEDNAENGRRQRPMEEVKQMFGMPSSSRAKSPNTEKSDEPIIHLTPLLEPTPKSGIDKIKDILREERVKAGEILNTNPKESQGLEFGKVILSPPSGHDGRIANKPRELMTPFERIRFGHADDLFNGNDDTPRRQGSSLFPVKRRNGFIALPMLNRQTPSWDSFVLQRSMEGSHKQQSRKLDDSLIIPEEMKNRKGQQQQQLLVNNKISPTLKMEGDEARDSIEDLVSVVADYDMDPPVQVHLEKKPLLVEENIPLCVDMKDQPCSTNSDCSCLGVGLYRCYAGQCQTLSLKGTVLEGRGSKEEIWHSQPLEFNDLGIWKDNASSDTDFILDVKKKKRAIDIKKP